MQVGNVTWTAQLDTTQALKDFKNFEKQIGAVSKSLNDISLTPTVDHTNLVELNRHLELKLQHYKKVQAYFNQNPLKVRTEYGKENERISGNTRKTYTDNARSGERDLKTTNSILSEGFKRQEIALKRVEKASSISLVDVGILSAINSGMSKAVKKVMPNRAETEKQFDQTLTTQGARKLMSMSNKEFGTDFDISGEKAALLKQMAKSAKAKDLMKLASGETLYPSSTQRMLLPAASESGRTKYRKQSFLNSPMGGTNIKEAVEIGSNYVKGVSQGMQFATPFVVKTVKEIGFIIDDELKKALDERSPSKKGAEKGRWYVEGVIKGFQALIPKLVAETKLIGQEIIDNFAPEGAGNILKDVRLKISDIGGALLSVGAGLVVFPLLAKGLELLTQGAFEAALRVENLTRLISFSTGNNGVLELERIRQESDKLGISFMASAEALKDFAGATLNTSLGTQSAELVSSFSKSFSAFGLSTEDQKLAFLALSQMASKGVVSMEELRQQLGERVPAAMGSAAASMGLTTAEFVKMVESGKVLAEDLLPLLAQRMEVDTTLGLRDSLKSTQAELNRFENNIFAVQAAVGQAQLAMAKFGLPILNASLSFLIKNGDTLLTLVIALSAAIAGNLVASLVQVVGINFFVTASFGAISLAIKGVMSALSTMAVAMAPWAAFLVLTYALTESIKHLVSYFNAGTVAIKKYSDAIKDSKAAQDSLKQVAPKETDNKQYDRQFLKSALSIDWFVDFVTGRSAKMAKQFVDDSDTIAEALQAVNDTVQGSRTSTKSVDLGNGKTVGADLSDQTVKEVQARLGELRNKQAQIRFSISVLGDEKDQDKVTKLKASLADVNKEIARVSTQPFESVIALEEQLKAVQALIQETEAKATENRTKGMDSRAKTYDNFAQEARQKEALIMAAIDKRNEAIKSTNDLYLKQIVSIRILQRELANIDYTTNLSGINGEIQAVQQFLNGGNTRGYDQAIRNSKATQINAKLVLSTAEFGKFETAVKDKLSKLDPALKQSVADYIGVDNLDKAILDKQISPNALAQLSGDLVPSQLKDTIEQSDDLKALLNLGQEYLGTWTDIKQTQLESANATKSQAEADKQRNTDLKSFQNQVQDFDTSVKDYFKQRARSLEDFDTQYADIATQNKRGTRNLVEQFNDLGRSINTQIQQVTNQLATTSKQIQQKILGNLARQSLNFGGGGVFSAFFDFLDGVINDSNSLQAQALTLEEERVQVATDTLALSVQIRGLQEQATDLETQRLRQLTDLARAQEDFAQSQAVAWLGIQRQSADMVVQAEAMGLNFTGIAHSLNGINQSYATIHNAIANFSSHIASSGGFGGGNAIGLQGESASGLNSIIAVGKYLQTQGFAIGEHSAFNGGRVETTGHARNSNHYKDLALDINADQMKGGEKANLDKLYTWLDANRKLMGITELIWNNKGGKGHTTHLHVAFDSKEWKDAMQSTFGGTATGIQNARDGILYIAQQLKVNAKDVATLASFEHGGKGELTTSKMGGAGGKYMGYIQFSPDNRKTLGLSNNPTHSEYAQAVVKYMKRRGLKEGASLAEIYHQINPGFSTSKLMKDLKANGHYQRADQILGGMSGPLTGSTGKLSSISAPNMSSVLSQMGKTMRPAQLRNIVGMFDADSLRGKTNSLRQKGSQLSSLKTELNSAQKEQLQQDLIAQQLNAEKALAEQAKSLKDTFVQQVDAMTKLNKEFLNLSRNAKGFLTYTENTQIASEELKASFAEFKNQIEEVGLALQKTLDMTDNPQEVNKAIDSYVEALKKRTDISPEFLNKLTTELIPQLREGAQSLTDLTPQLKAIENGFAEIEQQTIKTNQELTLFNQLLKLNSDFSAAAQSFSDLMSSEDVAMSTSFNKLVKQSELANKFAESRKELQMQINNLKLEIANPNSVIDKQSAKEQLSALSYALEQLTPEIEFKVRAKADLQFDFEASQSKMNAIMNLQQNIGDRKRSNNPFDGMTELRLAKINENASKLALQLKEIDDLRSQFKGNEVMLQYLSQLELETTKLAEIDFAGIESQVNVFAQAIGQPLESAFTSLFTDVIQGTKTVEDVLKSFLQSVAGYFAQIAAKMAAQSVMNALFPTQQQSSQNGGFNFGGLLSGLVGSLFGGGSTPTFGGGVLSVASGVTIPHFANGGEIFGLGMNMAKAMKREGVGAVPLVGHIGEHLLSAKNGDAQRYRQWKAPLFDGFSSASYSNKLSSPSSLQGHRGNTTTFNITTPNADSFRASLSQISQSERLRQSRLNRNL